MRATKYVPVLVVSHLTLHDLSEAFTGRVKLPRSEVALNLSHFCAFFCLSSYDCSFGDLDVVVRLYTKSVLSANIHEQCLFICGGIDHEMPFLWSIPGDLKTIDFFPLVNLQMLLPPLMFYDISL